MHNSTGMRLGSSYVQHYSRQHSTRIACKVQMELKPRHHPVLLPLLATPKTILSVGLGRLDCKTSAPALDPAALLPTPPSARVSTSWKRHSQRHPCSRPRTRSCPRSHPRLLSPDCRSCCRLSIIALATIRSVSSITRKISPKHAA